MYAPAVPCKIGYCLVEDEGGYAFQPPRTVIEGRQRPQGLRSVQHCPAVNAMERQLVEIPSPIALRMSLTTSNGELGLNVNPKGTFVDANVLGKMLKVEPQERWRDPKKPVLSLSIPFFFVTDEPCMATILPPFLAPDMRRWPGLPVATRYPVTDWPQNLTWMLEWDDFKSELILQAGQPLAYAMFEFDDPNKRPVLVEAARTADLTEFRAGIDGVHHITADIEALWQSARSRRPQRLMVPQEELDGQQA